MVDVRECGDLDAVSVGLLRGVQLVGAVLVGDALVVSLRALLLASESLLEVAPQVLAVPPQLRVLLLQTPQLNSQLVDLLRFTSTEVLQRGLV